MFFQKTSKRNNRFVKLLSAFLILAGLSYLIQSCDKDDEPAAAQPSLQLKASATLGTYIADSLGFTLYTFSNDFDGKSNCAGGCLNLWPIFYAGDNFKNAKLPIGLDMADFGTITTGTGAKQTTYKSWPLYYYSPNVAGVNTRELVGETKGEAFGNVWYVAKSDYTITLVNTQLIGNNGVQYKSDYTEGVGKTIYFANAKGVTLYTFVKDSFNVNKFTKPDFSNNATWPIYEQEKIIVPSSLDKTLFATVTIFGKKQLSYKGWPLYYFSSDSMMRGLNRGVSVPAPKVWPVAVKDMATAPKP